MGLPEKHLDRPKKESQREIIEKFGGSVLFVALSGKLPFLPEHREVGVLNVPKKRRAQVVKILV